MLKYLESSSWTIPLKGFAYSSFSFCCYNCKDTQDMDVFWEIQKADGEIETYIGPELNGVDTYHSEYQDYPDRGVQLYASCDFQQKTCYFRLRIHPIDLQYNGAQITIALHLPVCYTGHNVRKDFNT